MIRKILSVCIVLALALPVFALTAGALDFTAPPVPESGREYFTDDQRTFGQDLLMICLKALRAVRPDIAVSTGVCLRVVVAVILVSLLSYFPGGSQGVIRVTAAVLVGTSLLRPVNALIHLGVETVTAICEYGKLLLPVLTGALAAQGGATSSVALYAGTMLFNSILSGFIEKFAVPMVYIYLCFAVAGAAIGNEMLCSLRDFFKWLISWCLKIVLYVFTGYISITGVISGTADATAVKAARLAISGTVPVVGKIISDASETILVSAGVMKNAAGIYGILAVVSLLVAPFIKIAIQYLLVKATAAVCGIFGEKQSSVLVSDFAGAMGILLGMTGTVSLLQLISVVCFMKGVA